MPTNFANGTNHRGGKARSVVGLTDDQGNPIITGITSLGLAKIAKVATKNLSNIYPTLHGQAVSSGDGSVVTYGGFELTFPIAVAPNTTYTLSGLSGETHAIRFMKADNTFISFVAPSSFPYTFTTPATTAFLQYTAKVPNESTISATQQLEAGSSATSFTDAFAPIKVIVSGTSIDNGYGVSSGATYRELAAVTMSEVLGRRVIFVNRAQNGQQSSAMLSSLPSNISADPDAKVILFGGPINDAKPNQITAYQLEQNYRQMITLTKNAGMLPVLTVPGPYDSTKGNLATELSQTQRLMVCVVMRKLATELAIPAVDLDQWIAGNTSFCNDGLHPGDLGHLLIHGAVTHVLMR